MTTNMCLKYNHLTKSIRLILLMGCLETTFPGQVQTGAINQYSDGQSEVYKLCLEAQAAHISLEPNGWGPYSHLTALISELLANQDC